jgi:DNA invertase Pin-like site-specific DNA recombinase
MNGKRVGLYLRVSTGDQTIETQRMGLVAVCEARGWRIVEEFEDKGISGAKGREKRPGFRPALESGNDSQDRCCSGMVG